MDAANPPTIPPLPSFAASFHSLSNPDFDSELKETANGRAPAPEQRRSAGVFFTPPAVVRYLVRHTLEPLLGDLRGDHPLRILEPACGDGAILTEVFRYLRQHRLQECDQRSAAQGGSIRAPAPRLGGRAAIERRRADRADVVELFRLGHQSRVRLGDAAGVGRSAGRGQGSPAAVAGTRAADQYPLRRCAAGTRLRATSRGERRGPARRLGTGLRRHLGRVRRRFRRRDRQPALCQHPPADALTLGGSQAVLAGALPVRPWCV